jgi:hypothetical protein
MASYGFHSEAAEEYLAATRIRFIIGGSWSTIEFLSMQ